MNRAQIARMIDHTQVRAYATEVDIRELCEEARALGFATVAVNPAWTSYCAKQLAGSHAGVTACTAFPLGAATAAMKVEEARDAVKNGATEIDVVINVGALKSGYPSFVEKEIAAVVKAARGACVKVVMEASYLNEEEKIAVCEMSVRSGAAFIQTATGFGHGGATPEDITLIREVAGGRAGVKAAGGIRTYGDVLTMIQAGATRIGTSAGVEILEDAP